MTTSTDVAFDQATLERFADLADRLRRQRPEGPGRGHRRRARQGGDGPRARGQRLSARRQVRRRPVLRHARQARAHPPRRRGDARLRAAVVRQADPRARPPALRAHRALRPRHARAARRPRSPPRRPRPAALRPRGRRRRQRAHDELDDRALPDAGLGAARCTRSSSRDEALRRLAEQILHVCRLDEDDPVAAWRERADLLVGAAERVTERRFDALRFEGPGTDLTVGLLPTTNFMAARFETVDGIGHMPNLPSEEIFGAPDPQRTDGVVRATKPLVVGGSIIRGLEVEFRDGRAVRIDADEGADVLRGYAARDEGASRLGEVALVDGEGRIGQLDTVVLRHAARRERGDPHRAGRGLRVHRRRGGPPAPEPLRRSTSTS